MCLNPLTIPNKAKDAMLSGRKTMLVPCGKCIECLKDRQNSWIYRLFLEDCTSQHSLFVTLTYDQRSLPLVLSNGYHIRYGDYIKSKSICDCELTLEPDDFTKYMKRLRKSCGFRSADSRYFMCGEYGSDNGHPHYHMLFFYDNKSPEFVEQYIEKCWPFGFVTIEPVIFNRIAYVTKYITEDSDFTPSCDGQHPYYNRQSHGIGLRGYLDEKRFYGDFYKTAILPNGKVIQTPRYFRKKFYPYQDYQFINQLNYDEYQTKNDCRLIQRLVQDAKTKYGNPTTKELDQYLRYHLDNARKNDLLKQKLKSRRKNL